MENQILVNHSTTQTTSYILVIDDDPAMLRALSTLLGQFGSVTTASSVKSAKNAFDTRTFDVVVTDYELGDGCGLDVQKYVHAKNSELPVIFVTAFGNKDRAISTINEQVFGFVEKPFDPLEVEALIKRALDKKHKEDMLNRFATLGESMGELVHEIANPLTTISLKIQMLQNLAQDANNGELLAYSQKLSESAARIQEMIKWTKSALREVPSQDHKQLKIREVLDLLREECIEKATTQKVQVIITAGGQSTVNGNKDQLVSALVNLVNNAIDAASDNTERWVSVEVQESSNQIRITVTDSGRGISNDNKHKLFTPLFTTKNESGTGLGLVTVRKILRSHAGDVFLNENSPNTQFVVVLPAIISC